MANDIGDVRSRTRWTMGASMIGHALLLAFLFLVRPPAQGPELTEITLLDAGDPAAAAPAAAAVAAAAPRAEAAAANGDDQHFVRALPRASVAPVPQSTSAFEDQINSRLAALQRAAVALPAREASAQPAGMVWGSPAGVAAPTSGDGGARLSLHRGAGVGGSALTLNRGGTGTSLAPAIAATGIPNSHEGESAPAHAGEAFTRRSLAGATLAGPIADRAILHFVTPVYPEWAKHDGVEGSVRLYFVVRPDGGVTENVLVQKTAGFEEFDENARTALKAWRFEPLRDGRTGDQWGTITFQYRLRDTN
jgi:TonB family protein